MSEREGLVPRRLSAGSRYLPARGLCARPAAVLVVVVRAVMASPPVVAWAHQPHCSYRTSLGV